MSRFLIVCLTVLSALLLPTQGASASPGKSADVQVATEVQPGQVGALARSTKYCAAQFHQADVWCIMDDGELTADFHGGTLSIDVDLLGFHDNAQYRWTVKSNFGDFCAGMYYAADPARSWVCYNVPAGRLSLLVAKAGWHDASIGLRW